MTRDAVRAALEQMTQAERQAVVMASCSTLTVRFPGVPCGEVREMARAIAGWLLPEEVG